MKSRSRGSAPTTVKRTVPHGRRPNAEYRTREYLTEREVERLMKVAGNNRHGHRDATMILMAFRDGLRASELCSLRWEQVDLVHARLHVHRLKNGMPSVHPLTGTALSAAALAQPSDEPSDHERGQQERAEQRDEVAPFYARHGCLHPVRWVSRTLSLAGRRPQITRRDPTISYFSVDGLVSGIKNHMIEAASKPTDAILRNVAAQSKFAAANPKSAVLSAAPSPDAVPTIP
jgi:integrase